MTRSPRHRLAGLSRATPRGPGPSLPEEVRPPAKWRPQVHLGGDIWASRLPGHVGICAAASLVAGHISCAELGVLQGSSPEWGFLEPAPGLR